MIGKKSAFPCKYRMQSAAVLFWDSIAQHRFNRKDVRMNAPGAPGVRPTWTSSMIASFSRALTEGLVHSMTDAAFNCALAESIGRIYRAPR